MGDLLLVRRERLMEELAKTEDHNLRGACQEVDRLIKKIFVDADINSLSD